MTINGALYSSDKEDWETPHELFNLFNSEYNFTLDVCASNENTKCNNYYTKEIDGLKQQWNGTCWMNPPYGRNIGLWIEKAYSETQKNPEITVVCLLPARTDTIVWHQYIFPFAEVRFIKGRINFVGGKHTAPFPSAIVIFGKKAKLPNCKDAIQNTSISV
jgi:phage N-6-adenine-methyltransferase